MSKERGRDDTRRAIAVHAARLMAQDGIDDHGLAKRKAARLLGVPDARRLPNNEEVDAALREYREIYEGSDHKQLVRELRTLATKVMRELAAFDAHLTGAVLAGIAGRHALIHLQLFAEDPKGVELFLINRGIVYKAGEKRLYAGQELRLLPAFSMEVEGREIELTVLDARDLRVPLRASAAGRIIERARLPAVEALLEEP
ncbi:MAG: hypothetical protein Q8L65_10070 [Burkholderiales bacterium]|jgi:hypothetical protein|nr:hypothetical protein [Burkholderiales bacterium]MDP2400012.1 hypothetical protein [Burkholderiales bacterium]